MALPHVGSWGTWDLGLTELAAKLLGEKTTSDNGSDLSRDWAKQTTTTAPNLFNVPTQTVGTSQTTNSITNPQVKTSMSNIPATQSVPSNNPSVPSDNDLMNQINSLYNPGMDLLNQQESLVRSQGVTAKQGINDQAKYLQDMLDSQVKQMQGQTTDQQNAIELGKRSAMDEARNMFNALQQQTASRFGQGTGAGAFISDLQGQEYLRNQSKIQSGYTDSMKAIADYANRVQEFSMNEYLRIQREHDNALKAADDELNSRLLQINADRTNLQTSKAQQKIDVLRATMENARNLQNQRDSALFNLELWKQQQQGVISSQVNKVQNDWSQTLESQKGNIDAATTDQGFSQFGGGTTKTAPEYVAYKNPASLKSYSTDDSENNVFDPSSYFTA